MDQENDKGGKAQYWAIDITLPLLTLSAGKALTFPQALERVVSEKNVLAINELAAKTLANVAYPNPIGPEIAKNKKPGVFYMPHFHLTRSLHNHIFYFEQTTQ